MKRLPLFVLLSTALFSCGQPRISAPTSDENVIPVIEGLSKGLTSPASMSESAMKRIDWFDSLELFAKRWPTYAGYSLAADGSKLILYTTDNRSDNASKMHDEFVNLTLTSAGVPEVSLPSGSVADIQTMPYTYERVSYSRQNLNSWRAKLRNLMYVGSINKLSITDETNRLNIQVPDEQGRRNIISSLQSQGVPNEAVNITIGKNFASKTLYDTFTTPAGGVNVQYGSFTERCSLGLPVLANNVASYLIASHCSAQWGTSNDGTQLTQNAVKIGTKGLDNPFESCDIYNPSRGMCQAADTAIFTATGSFARARIIKTTGGTGSIDTGSSDTYYDVTSVSERPGNTATVSSIGASSGFRDATVVNADTDVAYEGYSPPRVVRRTVEVYRSSGAAACGGDSGGPWFQVTGTNTAKFLGITSGSTSDAPSKTRQDNITVTCGYTAYFSPVAMIRVAYPNVTFTFTR